MSLRIIGDHPFARDEHGALRCRIATIFPRGNALVTVPGIHATQRLAYVEVIDAQRASRGQPPLSEDEQLLEWENSVDLIVEDDCILIRPDPGRMPIAFEADEMLQELIPKQKIKFLHVVDDRVRTAIKRRGECWRISPLPTGAVEMKQMIARSRIGIGGREIYYYNRAGGTRYLTCQSFQELGALDDAALRCHLEEIRTYSARVNRLRGQEVDFFMAAGFGRADFARVDFGSMDGPRLRQAHADLAARFRDAVPPGFRQDDPDSIEWRNRMFHALIVQGDQALSEETLLGLSSEFFMQIHWLPGGRIEEGELIFDSVFDEARNGAADVCDNNARSLIFNFIREYGDLEYVNLGRVTNSLSRRPPGSGRRDVYIAEIKRRDSDREIVQIIRMQKWGVREHLDSGMPLLQAILQSEEYTDYILDRRLGCRQLGMNLPARITARKISEVYRGACIQYHGQPIWTPYFQRDYIRGIATDKMPAHRLAVEGFALRFAHLLGRAAAPNMIVGRCELNGAVVFDDGDEVVLEDPDGMPSDISVSDHTGTFVDYESALVRFGASYAQPVNRRLKLLPNPAVFAGIYVDAFVSRFAAIQSEYRKRRRAFDTLFHHRPYEHGSFAFRWEHILARLDATDPKALGEEIRRNIAL